MEINELLCNAIQTDRHDFAEMLINSGADVNYVDQSGKFPLFRAYEKNKLSQIKLLLSHGADINKKYMDISILGHESRKSKADYETLKLLMDNGADPNESEALLYLVRGNIFVNVELLLSYTNTNIDIYNINGVTPLRSACSNGSGDIVLLLLEKHADPNIQVATDGFTALMQSIVNDEIKVASSLILHDKVKLNLQDANGHTALHHACIHDQYEIVIMLLTRGADSTIKANDGRIASECSKSDKIKNFFAIFTRVNELNAKDNIKPISPVDTLSNDIPS